MALGLELFVDLRPKAMHQHHLDAHRHQFPESLPVSARRDEIAAAIAGAPGRHRLRRNRLGQDHAAAEDRLALGRGRANGGGLIGHTQPRRIAASSVAKRIAQELNTPLGEVVGYKVRFQDRLSRGATVKLMTDGILLAETQSDPLLSAYDTIIIDEAHERSLNIDFLLGYLRQILPRRPDLKVIVTSATIDAERFARALCVLDGRRRSSRCRAACTRSSSATGRSKRRATTT